MSRYVYLDESEFDSEQKKGYGALACEEPISDTVIDRAITELRGDLDRRDPRCKKLDYRTLERHWFHAADDSKNGHSHICTEISQSVSGVFFADFFDTGKLAQKDQRPEYAYHLSSQLSTARALTTDCPVHLVFEERN